MTNQDQMPYNAAIEQNIVSACMQKGDFLYRLKESGVTTADFYTPLPREIFRLMAETGKTTLTVLATMRTEETWMADIAEIYTSVVTTAPFSDWLAELSECSARRATISMAKKAIADAMSPEKPFPAILTAINAAVSTCSSQISGGSGKNCAALIEEYSAAMDAGLKDESIRYGMPIDRFLMHNRKEIVVLAGRPGGGKTTFMLQAMMNMIADQRKPAVYCGEMPLAQLIARPIANLATLNLYDVLSGKNRDKCRPFEQQLTEQANTGKFQLRGAGDYRHSVAGIRDDLRRFADKAGRVDWVAIDYLANLAAPAGFKNRDKRAEVDENLDQIRELAVEFNAPVLLLSQCNRDGLKGAKLDQNALKESAHITEVATAVVLLDMPENPGEAAEVKAIIDKNRNGKTGTIQLTMIPKYARIEPGRQPSSASNF